jgi:hypothetical protein
VKVNVYVDGFNLYYGIRTYANAKWLDLGHLSQLLLPGDSINRIRYFTARIAPWPNDPDKDLRQQAYLRALQTIPNLTIHYGHYLSHPTRMWLAHPPPQGPNTVEVIKTEEKGSDVNLATFLLLDAFDGDCELAVIVSNDSDLALPIQAARARFGLTVGILSPHRSPSRTLQNVASFYRPIRAGAIQRSQFPQTLRDSRGIVVKPERW